MPNETGTATGGSPLDRLPPPDLVSATAPNPPRQNSKGFSDLPEATEYPRLPPRAGRPYHLLIADDEDDFLDLMRLQAGHYRDHLTIDTLQPPDDDVVAWVRDRLDRGEPLDAIYVDRNLPAGKNGVEILAQLRTEVDAARYLPRVIMTADPAQRADEDTAALAAGAHRFMWKTSGHFLYEAALIVPQLRDAAQDEMWVDLHQEVTRKIAQHIEVRDLLSEVFDSLEKYFGIRGWYVRKIDEAGGLVRLNADDTFHGGNSLNPAEVPILADLLKDGRPRRVESLTEAVIGKRYIARLRGIRGQGIRGQTTVSGIRGQTTVSRCLNPRLS